MIEALLLAVALAMDALAVALSQGARFRPAIAATMAIALAFGLAQGVMPLIGWSLGTIALSYLTAIDHWIAFGLLAFIGGQMIFKHGPENTAPELTFAVILAAALATSIDALAAGTTLPALAITPLPAAAMIGAVTCVLSAIGAVLGQRVGDRYGRQAEIVGGIILIGLGCKIMFEHTIQG